MVSSIKVKSRADRQSAHQRLIALSLPLGPSHSIPLLLTYLDTYYTDAQGWSLLADLYCELGLYAQGLTALGHVLVVQGWDGGAVSRSGGVAYTMG
jgi:predicted Zn-dependent protease